MCDIIVFRNNTGFSPDLAGTGGCGMALGSEKATFASTVSAVQFSGNSGNYGPCLIAFNSSIYFHGPVHLAENRAAGRSGGAGGAFYLKESNLTFFSTATIRNNSAVGCLMVSNTL
jgi:hypothetical protein